MIIYKITNKLNGKLYIGQTIQSLDERMQNHRNKMNSGEHTKLYDAMRYYGWDNFESSIICSCSNLQTLNELERYFIKYYNTVQDGYNILEGGEHNPMTDEGTRKKHLARMQSLEVRQKISRKIKKLREEKGFSKETRLKISKKLKGNKHFLGRKRTLDAIQKTSRALFKPVYCIDRDNHIIAEFICLVDADKWWFENGYNTVKNYKDLSNMIKKSATQNIYIRGLKWIYK